MCAHRERLNKYRNGRHPRRRTASDSELIDQYDASTSARGSTSPDSIPCSCSAAAPNAPSKGGTNRGGDAGRMYGERACESDCARERCEKVALCAGEGGGVVPSAAAARGVRENDCERERGKAVSWAAGEGGGVSAFLDARMRGLDMTRRSHFGDEGEGDGDGEGMHSGVSGVSELVEPDEERMYGKKRLTGVVWVRPTGEDDV